MPIPVRLHVEPASDVLVRQMIEFCNEIENALESGNDATVPLSKWNRYANRECDLREFQTYWKSTDQESFVREVLNPKPALVSDLQYAEAHAVLNSLMSSELSEPNHSFYLEWLEVQFPNSEICDLIYWPDAWFKNPALFREPNGAFKPQTELSPDQILAYAMLRSSRRLTDAPNNILMPFQLPGK